MVFNTHQAKIQQPTEIFCSDKKTICMCVPFAFSGCFAVNMFSCCVWGRLCIVEMENKGPTRPGDRQLFKSISFLLFRLLLWCRHIYTDTKIVVAILHTFTINVIIKCKQPRGFSPLLSSIVRVAEVGGKFEIACSFPKTYI